MPAQILATPTGWVMKSSPVLRRWSAWCSQANTNAASTASRSIATAESAACSSMIANRSSRSRDSVSVRSARTRVRRGAGRSIVPTGVRGVIVAPSGAPLPRAPSTAAALPRAPFPFAAARAAFGFGAALPLVAFARGFLALAALGLRAFVAALPPPFTPPGLWTRSGIGARPRVAVHTPGRPGNARAQWGEPPGARSPARAGRPPRAPALRGRAASGRRGSAIGEEPSRTPPRLGLAARGTARQVGPGGGDPGHRPPGQSVAQGSPTPDGRIRDRLPPGAGTDRRGRAGPAPRRVG